MISEPQSSVQALRQTFAHYPIAVAIPDIRPWKTGNAGIDYVHTATADAPGPHVLVNALAHGNEVCGAIAVDLLLKAGLRPRRGRLSFCLANVAAYQRLDLDRPDANRCIDEDFNRLWSAQLLDGPRNSTELRRARELRPLVDDVDFLLDIHSMHETAPPLMLTGPRHKGVALARQVAAAAHLMIDAGHAAGPRLRDYGAFGDPSSGRAALLIECGQHFERSSPGVALDTACRFLVATGAVEPQDVAPWLQPPTPFDPMCIRVTEAVAAESEAFRFAANYRGMEMIPDAGTLIATDGARRITTPYDRCLLLQPSLRHLARGVTGVRLGRIETD